MNAKITSSYEQQMQSHESFMKSTALLFISLNIPPLTVESVIFGLINRKKIFLNLKSFTVDP